MEQADLSRSDEAAAINRKLAALRRNRSRLKSQLEALYINIDGHTAVTRGDIRDLAFFFPDVNTVELQSIEDFHQRLRAVLESEMSEERSQLQSSIDNLDAEIRALEEQYRSLGIPTRLPTPFLQNYSDLTMRINDLNAQIDSFQKNSLLCCESRNCFIVSVLDDRSSWNQAPIGISISSASLPMVSRLGTRSPFSIFERADLSEPTATESSVSDSPRRSLVSRILPPRP